MIERFHHSLKSSLLARLANSDWVTHLPLEMLGLRSSPKGDFLKHSELSPEGFLRKVEQAVLGFSGPPRHHVVPQPQPQPLPRALMDSEFVFVRDDASKPPLSPLYRTLTGQFEVHHLSLLPSVLTF